MDTRITTTTQDGIYIVYLYSDDGNVLYLTLNQCCRDLVKGMDGSLPRRSFCKDLQELCQIYKDYQDVLQSINKLITSREREESTMQIKTNTTVPLDKKPFDL